jgi:predicted phage-related endonuclease
MSPYVTHFELWHRKQSGEQPEFQQNERMRWGNRLEAAIAHGIAEERGWTIEPMKDYWRDPDARIGSSFDFLITNDPDGPAHLEIKNVDYLAFRNGWLIHDDGEIEAPEHIEMQVQHQMAVSGFKKAYVCAFVGGNRYRVIERHRSERVIAAIRLAVAKFWRSVSKNEPPPPMMPEDADALIRLHSYAEPGKILDASSDAEIASLVREYQRASLAEKEATEDKQTAKAQLLERIGDAERVLGLCWTISASMIADTPPTTITAEMIGTTYGGRKGYRGLRITTKKGNKQ